MRFRSIGLLALAALLLSGCAGTPEIPRPTPVHFRACQVSERNTDTQSDSEQITYALQKAKIANGIHLLRAAVTLSKTSTEAVLEPMLKHNCSLVVTSGQAMAPLAAKAAALHASVNFLSVVYDDSLNEFAANAANFRTIQFNVKGAAFLAGYAAASTSKVGTVAVIGGKPTARTKQYVQGFKDGVAHYNEVQAADVMVLGDELTSPTYVGSTSDASLVQTAAAQAYAFGADVVFVAAGPASTGAGAVATLEKTQLIFTDSDWWFDPAADAFKEQILTAAVVNLQTLVYANTVAALQNQFSTIRTSLVADLANAGTGLATTHNAAFSVSLANELAQLTKDINDGKVTIQ